VDRTVSLSIGPRAVVRGPKRLLRLRSDERLVTLVRAGDDAAFEVLYERHAAAILGFCLHMLGSQDEAEDAVQQAFVAAHRDMQRAAREINFKPWLYTIARNRCLSMLRARRERASELPEISTVGLDEQVERRGELRQLVADVQRLPDDQRAALVLSEVGDLSHAEVAEVIGVQPHAVKALVYRARTTLIERRDAQQADCREIREELATAKGGAFRRSRLRYHLESCPGCAAYLEEVRRQRKLLGVALPVVPTLALHDSVMASAGIGASAATAGAVGGAAVGGAASTAGIPLLGGTLAKVAVVGVLAAGGAGVATEVARDGDGSGGGAKAPAQSAPGADGGIDGGEAGAGSGIAGRRSQGLRGAERRALGQQRARERSGGHAVAGDPRGRALGRSGALPGLRKGHADGNPGKALGHDRSAPTKSGRPASPAQGKSGSGGQGQAKSQGGAGAETAKPAPGRGRPEGSAAPDVPPGKSKAPSSTE
jgi:RNA polymerase sigma factor (sigma-70 family)